MFYLDQFLPYRLNRAAEWISLGFAAHYRARYGMTRPEWRALAALGSLGAMTATGIGAHSNMHKTKVSRAVRSLEERRWIRRSPDPLDRRVEHLELTGVGRKAYADLVELATAYQATLEQSLGAAGVSAINDGLDKIERAHGRRGKARV